MSSFACLDWEARIRARRSLIPRLSLNESEVEIAVAFFDGLRLPDVPGTPLLADACGDWFREIVGALFGSRDPATNERFLREIFLLAPKGSSKTSYGAGLMLTALLMNERPAAEFLMVGPTQATSDIAFSQAMGMIELDPQLKRRFKTSEHIKEIKDRTNGARLKVKTFDLQILTGPKPAGVLLDELHLLGKHVATPKVLRQIRGGLEKNSEGFLVIISTQSDEQPAGAFREELMMARSIRDGKFDGRMLPILYEFPDDIANDAEKWGNPANWDMVMPNLGRSVRLESLIKDFDAEREKGESAMKIWASQALNLQVDMATRSDGWVGAAYWEGAADEPLTLETLLERSETVCIGIDGGGLDDLFGLCVLGREPETKRWLAWCHAWAHESVLTRRKSEAQRLRDLAAAGDLTIIERAGAAITGAMEIIQRVEDAGILAAVGLDPYGVGELVDAMTEADIVGDRVKGVSQGFKLMTAIKTAERRLADKTLVHAGQPLMTWCVANAKIEPRGNAVLLTKAASGTGKIDPLMALLNAIAVMSVAPESTRSIWDRPDLAGSLRW